MVATGEAGLVVIAVAISGKVQLRAWSIGVLGPLLQDIHVASSPPITTIIIMQITLFITRNISRLNAGQTD